MFFPRVMYSLHASTRSVIENPSFSAVALAEGSNVLSDGIFKTWENDYTHNWVMKMTAALKNTGNPRSSILRPPLPTKVRNPPVIWSNKLPSMIMNEVALLLSRPSAGMFMWPSKV